MLTKQTEADLLRKAFWKTASVVDLVQRQQDLGIDIPNDGEYGHAMSTAVDYGAWWSYSFARMGGLELDNHATWAVEPKVTGTLVYTGQEAVASDIANLKAGLAATGLQEGFVAALSPGSASRITNEYYATEEEYIYACADALREECRAIIDAGLILQIDDPSIAENWDQISPEPSVADYLKFTQIRAPGPRGRPYCPVRRGCGPRERYCLHRLRPRRQGPPADCLRQTGSPRRGRTPGTKRLW